MLRDPPITTRAELKRALTTAQVAMLKFAKTFSTPPTTITMGLGRQPKEDLENRRKTNQEILEAMKRYQFKSKPGSDPEEPMEISAIIKALEEEQECSEEESEEELEDKEPLFFMKHNHEHLRAQEDSDTQNYWEAGFTSDTLNALKQGSVDHSGKVCYHCSRKGQIKANFPARKRLDSKPWERRRNPREKKGVGFKGYGTKRERSKPSTRNSFAKRKGHGGAQAIHPEGDFGTRPAEN